MQTSPAYWMPLILEARARIAPYLRRTSLHFNPLLSDLVGTEIYVKHENHQPIGAFKVRGGINLVASLSGEERRRGVITASTGNHGQSIAYAARLFGVKAIIGVPEDCNPAKLAAMRSWGAEIMMRGRDFDESREAVEARAANEGLRYVHSANEPMLIAGVATMALEVFEDLPHAEYIFCAVGGGSGCSGTALVAKALNPSCRVVGVGASLAASACESWRRRELFSTGTTRTFAEGVATRVPFEMTQRILWDHLEQFVLVSEEEMRAAIIHYLERGRVLAEGAGAASLAAAIQCREEIRGKKVVVYLSGGNIARETIVRILGEAGNGN